VRGGGGLRAALLIQVHTFGRGWPALLEVIDFAVAHQIQSSACRKIVHVRASLMFCWCAKLYAVQYNTGAILRRQVPQARGCG
jgi:hypothetical protein